MVSPVDCLEEGLLLGNSTEFVLNSLRSVAMAVWLVPIQPLLMSQQSQS